MIRSFIAIVLAADLSMLCGVACALSIQYFNPRYFVIPYRTHAERGMLAVSYMLLLLQAVVSFLWVLQYDDANRYVQFPVTVRAILTFPALVLANIAFIRRAIRIERRKR